MMTSTVSLKNRKSNFELLRIFAMLIIVADHYATHGLKELYEGGQLQQWNLGSISDKLFTSFLVPGGDVGVAIFFMLTGYFMIRKRTFSLLKVVLEVIFYGLFTGVIYFGLKSTGLFAPYIYIFNQIKQTVIPISGGAWWFPTVYVLLIVFSPILNKFLNQLNDRGFFSFLILDWILWYIFPIVLGGVYTGLERGIFFYSLGGMLRTRRNKSASKTLLVILFIISWVSISVLDYFWTSIYFDTITVGTSKTCILLMMFISGIDSGLLIPLCAVSIFMFFEGADLEYNKIINTFAACTFGVYLIHDSAVGATLFWKIIFRVAEKQYVSRYYPLLAIGTVLTIYCVCSLIDFCRLKLIEPRAMAFAQSKIDEWKEKYVVVH